MQLFGYVGESVASVSRIVKWSVSSYSLDTRRECDYNLARMEQRIHNPRFRREALNS